MKEGGRKGVYINIDNSEQELLDSFLYPTAAAIGTVIYFLKLQQNKSQHLIRGPHAINEKMIFFTTRPLW